MNELKLLIDELSQELQQKKESISEVDITKLSLIANREREILDFEHMVNESDIHPTLVQVVIKNFTATANDIKERIREI